MSLEQSNRGTHRSDRQCLNNPQSCVEYHHLVVPYVGDMTVSDFRSAAIMVEDDKRLIYLHRFFCGTQMVFISSPLRHESRSVS